MKETLQTINDDFTKFQEELEKRSQKLKLNSDINHDLPPELEWFIEEDRKNYEID